MSEFHSGLTESPGTVGVPALGRILALKSGPGSGARKRPKIWAPQPATPLSHLTVGATCRGPQMHGGTVHLLSYNEQPLYDKQRNLEWNNATRLELERQHFEIWTCHNKHRTCLAGFVSATVRHSDLMHHNWETRRTQDWGDLLLNGRT